MVHITSTYSRQLFFIGRADMTRIYVTQEYHKRAPGQASFEAGDVVSTWVIGHFENSSYRNTCHIGRYLAKSVKHVPPQLEMAFLTDHAKHMVAGRMIPFLVLGFWDKITGMCAGVMPHFRNCAATTRI